MITQYLASFLLTSAFLLYNPQVFLSDNATGNVEVYHSSESGENNQFNSLLGQQEIFRAGKECKWSTMCTGPTYSCRTNCAESSNMQPSGSWVPAVPTQTTRYGCMGKRTAVKCLCCKK